MSQNWTEYRLDDSRFVVCWGFHICGIKKSFPKGSMRGRVSRLPWENWKHFKCCYHYCEIGKISRFPKNIFFLNMTVGRDHQGCWKMRQSHLQRQGGKRGREGARERRHGFSNQTGFLERSSWHMGDELQLLLKHAGRDWSHHRFCFREVHSPSCENNPKPATVSRWRPLQAGWCGIPTGDQQWLGPKIRMVKIIIFPCSKAPYILAHYRLYITQLFPNLDATFGNIWRLREVSIYHSCIVDLWNRHQHFISIPLISSTFVGPTREIFFNWEPWQAQVETRGKSHMVSDDFTK